MPWYKPSSRSLKAAITIHLATPCPRKTSARAVVILAHAKVRQVRRAVLIRVTLTPRCCCRSMDQAEAGQHTSGEGDAKAAERLSSCDGLRHFFCQFIEFVIHDFASFFGLAFLASLVVTGNRFEVYKKCRDFLFAFCFLGIW